MRRRPRKCRLRVPSVRWDVVATVLVVAGVLAGSFQPAALTVVGVVVVEAAAMEASSSSSPRRPVVSSFQKRGGRDKRAAAVVDGAAHPSRRQQQQQQQQKQEEAEKVPSTKEGGTSTPRAVARVGDASKKQGAYGKVVVHKESTLSQWLRVDEVLAALVLLHIRPLRSNLAASRDDEQGDDDLDSDNKKSHNYIRDRYAASPSGRDDLEFCSDMLVKVSRSFASVIHQLPSTLLVDIMVFYLVLRALDTIEDDTSLPSKIKITALENFAQKALLSKKDEPWTLVDDSGVVVAVGDGDERELLLQFDKVRRIFDRLPVPSQDVIVDITHRMAHGMASFVNRDFRQGTLNIEEYNLYCHYVAGLVGEGLSRLFAASGMETDPIFSSSSDQHLSNQMGLFLQKTNIIRDYLEDYVDGRAFWPQSIWKRHAAGTGDLGYFVLQNDPFVRKRSMRCLNELVTDALELVPDCLTYMGRLRCEEIFRFCAIPQVMAVATLEKCFGNLDVFTGVVKIRRGLSCKLILDHSSTLPQVHETFERFAKRICRKARRLLLATTTTTSEDATDPQSSLRRTLAACDAICDLTRPLASRLRLIRTLSRIQWALVLYALFTPSALDRAVFGAVAALLWIATTFLNKRLLEGTEQQEQHPRLIGARVLEQQVAREQMLPQALA